VIHPPPTVTADSVTFRLPDRPRTFAHARLLPALTLPEGTGLDLTHTDGAWRLTLARPPVARMEYRFQVRHTTGDLEEICDPGNPLRAPGVFGDKSVVEFPGYAPPRWLTAPRAGGRRLEVTERVSVWSPADPAEPLPLLVAHDGPEYDRLAGLTVFAAALVDAGRLPPHRIALLAADHRDDEYSANPAHAAALHDTVLPAIRAAVAVRGPVVGMGASLGGLAALHAQRTRPGLFGGLFLQSASFLTRALDPQEQRFGRFDRVDAFVARVRATRPRATVPVVMTCGTAEENLANNRAMAAVLRAQGYPVRLVEVPDAHNHVGWRDAFDPALAELLREVWMRGG